MNIPVSLSLGPLAKAPIPQKPLLVVLVTRTQLHLALGWPGPTLSASRPLDREMKLSFPLTVVRNLFLPRTKRLEGVIITPVPGPKVWTRQEVYVT